MPEYPEYKFYKEFEIEDTKRLQKFTEAEDMCVGTGILTFAFNRFFSGKNPYFKDGFDFFSIPDIAEIIANNTLALAKEDGVPEIPMFVFHGTDDEVVPFSGAQRAYNNYCEWGIESLEFAVSNTTGHLLEVVEGSTAAIKWLEDRFDGKDAVKGCKRTVRTTNLAYPGADLTLYQLINTAIKLVGGDKIGDLPNRNVTLAPEFYTALQGWATSLIKLIEPLPVK